MVYFRYISFRHYLKYLVYVIRPEFFVSVYSDIHRFPIVRYAAVAVAIEMYYTFVGRRPDSMRIMRQVKVSFAYIPGKCILDAGEQIERIERFAIVFYLLVYDMLVMVAQYKMYVLANQSPSEIENVLRSSKAPISQVI